MPNYYHGVSTRQVDTSLSTPVTADCGVAFVVGAAPVHTVGGPVNEPVMVQNYAEAVSAMGYSDDWEKYPICEMIYSQFKLYSVSPVVFVNILDPTKHKKAVEEKNYPINDGKVLLPLEALKDSVRVTTYTVGKDYDLFYEGENLILEVLEGGTIPENTGELTISFDAVNPSAITENEIIGGFDTNTKKSSGLELYDSIFPKYGIVADLVLCPGWSHKSTVAAVMVAKAASINGVFEGKAMIDVDTTEATHYADVPAWKKAQNINNKGQILCWPMVKLGDYMFHLSTQLCGLMASVDGENRGVPYESPSNKNLKMDACCLADGTPVNLTWPQVEMVSGDWGVVTAVNFMDSGWVAKGNYTACFPGNTDVKDQFIPVSRMFDYIGNTLIRTFWPKQDKPLTPVLRDSILQTCNIWLGGLCGSGYLYGARCELLAEENPLTSLLAGHITLHVYNAPPVPAQRIDFILEYDVSYVEAALTA